MSSSMKAYLAEKYMSGPKADAILTKLGTGEKKKKKKRKQPESSSSSWIKDDDASVWKSSTNVEDAEDEEDSVPVVASDRRFKKKRKLDAGDGAGGWSTLQEGYSQAAMREPTPPPPEDEEPQVVGGLMTAAQLKTKTEREQKQKLSVEKQQAADDEAELARMQETVYRDATGRKIDTKAEKAAAAKAKREREEKEAAKLQWGKGLVQKEEKAALRKEQERMGQQKGFRNRDDAKMNEEMKNRDLWNDPAMQFITKKKSKGPRRPEYTGPPPPPNRFGIKPGYRWDGVDRGTGFEKKFFQASNSRRRHGAESHQWSVEDM
ncbi:Pre-mRNA-splicing factor of RES complex-domain-containing protein [Flagelloscypha sp. PMI_526]|nr:Pre-mRNA-splicing factor of RES complex-domain-containing protein [Flagelloscypha sp. PMI_526]